MEPKDRIIVALDGLDGVQAIEIINKLVNFVGGFKIGLELITKGLAAELASYVSRNYPGRRVFYDGKFHDIDQTVANAATAVCSLPSVLMFNVHCLGGVTMMQAAKKAVDEARLGKADRPLILGVTILTSHDCDSLVQIGLIQPWCTLESSEAQQTIQDLVVRLARLANYSGLDGVICSPWEIEVVRKACGKRFVIVTPGVRPAGAAINDQKRVMTPGDAVNRGADYLVIGRPLLKPENGNPVEAAQRIAEEIAMATAPCLGRD